MEEGTTMGLDVTKERRKAPAFRHGECQWPNNDIEKLVAVALLRGHKVVVNADW